MHAEAASCISLGVSLSECMQLPSVVLHSWALCSLLLPSCTRPESASCLLQLCPYLCPLMPQLWLAPPWPLPFWQIGYRLTPPGLAFLGNSCVKNLPQSNFLRTETQVLRGYTAKYPRQNSSHRLWLCTLVPVAARPAGFPFPVPLWSRIPSFGTAWSSYEKMSSTVCAP